LTVRPSVCYRSRNNPGPNAIPKVMLEALTTRSHTHVVTSNLILH
jgi:hypothetical protein